MKKQRDGSAPGTPRGESAEQLQPRKREGAPKSAQPESYHASGHWEATFDAITDLVSIIDTDFRLVKVNKAFADTVGMTPQELIGRKCYEVVHNSGEPG